MYKLSPSKAHRFLYCTKSLEYDGEFIDTQITIRGKILHKFAEMKIKNEDTRQFEEENKFNDYEYFLVNAYVQAIWAEYNLINAKKILVEKKESMQIYGVKINYIIDALIQAWNLISIVDLKTGNGDVDFDDNEQLLMYGYGITINNPEIKNIRLSIFQKGKLKTSIITQDEVMDFFIDKFDVFEEIQSGNLTFRPGDKVCKFCNAKDTCLARAKWIAGGKDGITKV